MKKELEKDLLDQGLSETAVGVCLDAIKFATTWQVNPSTFEKLKEGQAILAYSFGIGERKDGQKEREDSSKVQYSPDFRRETQHCRFQGKFF